MSDYQRWKCMFCGFIVEMLYGHGKPTQCPACGKREFRPIGIVTK
jgi:rubrerythrin